MKYLRRYIRNLLLEYVSQQDLEDVMQTTQLVHHGQKRRSGAPYMIHPMFVYNMTKRFYPRNKPAQLLALLHDTIEDVHKQGNLTEDELRDMIRYSIHDQNALRYINMGLSLLTHDKSIPYHIYLQSVLKHRLAGIVKISDLIHNLSQDPKPSQIIKYKTALKHVKMPWYVNRDHLNLLKNILETQ